MSKITQQQTHDRDLPILALFGFSKTQSTKNI